MKGLLFLILLLCVPFVSAATLHGTVYDFDFDVVENTIIEVNSQPKQSMIAIDGTYSFELNPGEYTLEAKYIVGDSLISSVSEEINIVDEGDYVLDLILFPNLDDELVEDFEFDEAETNNSLIYLAIFLIIIIIFFIFLKKKPKKRDLDKDEAEDVLKFIKKEGGRTTQKEIRKNIGLGEAKVSLIITELEHKKKVKRIKKGRGNIIILNK
jgi:uncharacterized membrane protein